MSEISTPNLLTQAYLKAFFKLSPSLRCDGIQQLVGRSMPILEAHEVVKKIEKLLHQTTSKGVKVKSITEELEPVIVGTCMRRAGALICGRIRIVNVSV